MDKRGLTIPELQLLLLCPEKFRNWNGLLEEIFSGHSPAILGTLLKSASSDVRIGGLFVCDELHERASVFHEEIVDCLSSDDRKVRYAAYVAIESCLYDGEVPGFSRLASGLCDEHPSCRQFAMLALARARESELNIIAHQLAQIDPEGSLHTGIGWLISQASGNVRVDMLQGLAADDPIRQRFAAIAACRHSWTDPPLLDPLKEHPDLELRWLAKAFATYKAIRLKHRRLEGTPLGTGA